jgi:hypothetical protein
VRPPPSCKRRTTLSTRLGPSIDQLDGADALPIPDAYIYMPPQCLVSLPDCLAGYAIPLYSTFLVKERNPLKVLLAWAERKSSTKESHGQANGGATVSDLAKELEEIQQQFYAYRAETGVDSVRLREDAVAAQREVAQLTTQLAKANLKLEIAGGTTYTVCNGPAQIASKCRRSNSRSTSVSGVLRTLPVHALPPNSSKPWPKAHHWAASAMRRKFLICSIVLLVTNVHVFRIRASPYIYKSRNNKNRFRERSTTLLANQGRSLLV